jgi:hypothetical protein
MNMGVTIDKNNVIIIDMLSELEQARQALCDKAKNDDADMIKNNNTDFAMDDENSENEDQISENKSVVEETHFESDGFSMITTKRIRKATQRLSLSGKASKTYRSKKVNKGVPCLSGDKGEENQGAPNTSDHTPAKKKKGRKNERSNLEL